MSVTNEVVIAHEDLREMGFGVRLDETGTIQIESDGHLSLTLNSDGSFQIKEKPSTSLAGGENFPDKWRRYPPEIQRILAKFDLEDWSIATEVSGSGEVTEYWIFSYGPLENVAMLKDGINVNAIKLIFDHHMKPKRWLIEEPES